MSSSTQALRKWIARQPRMPQWVRATLRNPERGEFGATITNISDGGCRLRFAEGLAEGDLVTIEVASLGCVPARIRWAENGAAGAQFLATALAPSRFAA